MTTPEIKIYLDRNRRAVNIGDSVSIQHCVGRYGETRVVSGVIEAIDQYRGVLITLSNDTNTFRDYSNIGTLEFGPGSKYYVAGAFRAVNGEMIGYYKHDDFEHGHESWLEVKS